MIELTPEGQDLIERDGGTKHVTQRKSTGPDGNWVTCTCGRLSVHHVATRDVVSFINLHFNNEAKREARAKESSS